MSHPELVVVAGWTLLDEGAVVRGDVAVVTVLLQHVDLGLDLLLFLLGDVHHLYSGQLSRLHMAPLRRNKKRARVYKNSTEQMCRSINS